MTPILGNHISKYHESSFQSGPERNHTSARIPMLALGAACLSLISSAWMKPFSIPTHAQIQVNLKLDMCTWCKMYIPDRRVKGEHSMLTIESKHICGFGVYPPKCEHGL